MSERPWLVALGVWAALCVVVTVWASIDRHPPEWDYANHLERALECHRTLANPAADRFGEIMGASAFYPPLAICTAGALYLVFPVTTLTAQAVMLLFLGIAMFSVYGIGRTVADPTAGPLIERISGRASVIAVLRIYVDICGDLETAAVLSQCVFWSDKGSHDGGWFYKSREEWHSEIGIKRAALESAIRKLKELYIVETKVMPAKHNSPTTFYRVEMNNLTQAVISHLQNRLAEIGQSNARSVENSQSDLLKTANPSAENSQSSYSSLQHYISSEASQGETGIQNTEDIRVGGQGADPTLTRPLPGQDTLTPAQAWQAALGEIQLEMTRATFETWVKPIVLLAVNGTWQFAVPNQYAQEWLDLRLKSTVKRVLAGIVGQPVELEFVVVPA